jgi:transposase
MIEADKRKAVFHQEGMSINEITRRLHLSRNTVCTILKQKGEMPVPTRPRKVRLEGELLERLYRECEGRAQRVHEKLSEEEGIHRVYPRPRSPIPCSTLTRRLREA